MKESARREQIILQMIIHRIDIACFQEVHMILTSKPEINTPLFSPQALYKKNMIGESASASVTALKKTEPITFNRTPG